MTPHREVFKQVAVLKNVHVCVTFFELYGGRIFDLLNDKKYLTMLEDKNQNVVVVGLKEQSVKSAEELLKVTFQLPLVKQIEGNCCWSSQPHHRFH